MKTENDKLNHQVIALTKEKDSFKQERVQLQEERGFLEELCANLEKENQHLTDKLKKLESAQKNLENSENLGQAEKITNEQIEKTLEIVSYSDVDVDFEKFSDKMLNVDHIAVGLKSYDKTLLTDLNGGYWDLEAPGLSKESVTFRFDNLPKDPKTLTAKKRISMPVQV